MSFLETDEDYSKKLRQNKSGKQLENKTMRFILKARRNRGNRKVIESEKDFYEQHEKVIFGATIILTMKVMVIKIKPYQLKNVFRS